MNVLHSRTLLALLLAMPLGFTSCDLDDDDTIIVIDRDLSEEDAQELIATFLSYDSYGLVAEFERIGEEIENVSDCGEETVNQETEDGEYWRGEYEYSYSETYSLQCEPSLLIDYDLTGIQEIDALNYDSTQEITMAFAITGLEQDALEEIYNGIYNRTGDWESDANGEGYDFEYESTVNTIRVSKESNQIQSGTSTFSLTQTYSRDNLTYSYSGTIEFLNANEAEVTFEDGETFIVDLTNVSISD